MESSANSYLINKKDSMKILLIISIMLLLLASCNNPQKLKENEIPIFWETLLIKSRSQIITINYGFDYGIRDVWNNKEINNEGDIIYEPINHRRETFSITKQEQDSLFKYIYDIIMNPVYTEQYATCYVGNISIGFITGNTTLSCEYNSVGNWTTISPSMLKVYSLLKVKTEIPEY